MSATRIEVDHVKFKTLFAGTFHEEWLIGLLKPARGWGASSVICHQMLSAIPKVWVNLSFLEGPRLSWGSCACQEVTFLSDLGGLPEPVSKLGVCSVALACVTLCSHVDCGPPGSSVHGISQARTPKWVVISFSGGSFLNQGSNTHLLHWQVDSFPLSHRGSLMIISRSIHLYCWTWHYLVLFVAE